MIDQQQITPDNVLLQSRIIVGALAAGAVMFTVVAAALVLTQGPFAQDDQLRNILLAVAALLILATTAIAVVIGNATAKLAKRAAASAPTPEEGEAGIAQHYAQMLVIRGALAEGPTLYCIVIFLLSGFWPALVGLLIGLAHFAVIFPTRERLDRFTARALGMR